MYIYRNEQLTTEPTRPIELEKTLKRKCYNLTLEIVGSVCLLVQLVLLIPAMIGGWLSTIFCCCCYGKQLQDVENGNGRQYYHEKQEHRCIEKLCYTSCFCKRNRRFWGTIRLNLLTVDHNKRGMFWNAVNHVTGMSSIIHC